jgi:hypothetical protein
MDKLSRFQEMLDEEDFFSVKKQDDETSCTMLIDISILIKMILKTGVHKHDQKDLGDLEKAIKSILSSAKKTGKYLEEDEDDSAYKKLSSLLKYAGPASSQEKYSAILEAGREQMLALINEMISDTGYVAHEKNLDAPAPNNDLMFAEYEPQQHLRAESAEVEAGENIFRLKYEKPIFYNSQWTYQRFFMEDAGSHSVYELTKNISEKTGTDIEMVDDPALGKYVASIDGIKDGNNGKYWEFWIVDRETGDKRIGELSIDQQTLKKSEFVEWRLADEQEYGCGGGGGNEREKFVAGYFNNNTGFTNIMPYGRNAAFLGINLNLAY